MSPQLEAVIMATLGAFTLCACVIAWALVRLARGGDRWTDAANTLGRRVTAVENRLNSIGDTGSYRSEGGTDPHPSVAPVPSGALWISSRLGEGQ